MTADPIWRAFSQTGDPLYYLLYRAVHETDANQLEGSMTASQAAQIRG